MKIIFLNTGHAIAGEPFYHFLKSELKDTDIFCLGEVDTKMFSNLSNLFTDFSGRYVKNTPRNGQAVFIKKNIDVLMFEKHHLFKQREKDSGSFITFEIKTEFGNMLIGSVEGKVRPGNKLDTPIRLKQSQSIIESFKISSLPKIILGDFNLLPETKSIQMFKEAGYRNLINEFKIKSTRNEIAWENLKSDHGFVKQHFADYCFVSPDINVKKFEVPDLPISDHLPLILEFEV